MKKREVMIDLETLRQKNDPVVISVVAIEFERSGIIKDTRLWYLDLNDSLRHGFQINKDTLIWWLQFPELLKSQIDREDTCSVQYFLEDFEEWIKEESIIWGDAAFDQNIIESMYDKFNMNCPIYFRNYRDVRTIKGLADELNFEINIERKEHHSPLDDALYNVKYLIEFYKMLGELNGKTD